MVSIIVVLSLLGENVDAKWGALDDHEIMWFLGDDGKASWSEFPGLLMKTEVANAGYHARFRPSYYIVRVAETILWGDSPRLWYIARLVMFALSFALFWRALSWWIGVLPAVLVVLYCLTYPFWADIWCRLGPGEIYCVLGTAMFVFGMGALIRSALRGGSVRPRLGLAHWLLATAGAFLAMGSKENFLVMLLPLWALVLLLLVKKRFDKTAAVCSVLTSAYGLFIMVVTLKGLHYLGRDVYGSDVSAGYRMGLAVRGVRQVVGEIRKWDVAAVSALAGAFAARLRDIRKLFRPLVRTAVILMCLLALYISQFVFYDGHWPHEYRYDFPGVLAYPLYWVVLAVLGLDILRIAGTNPRLIGVFKWAVVVLVFFLTFNRGFNDIRWRCKSNVRRTVHFTLGIENAVSRLRQEPERPVIVQCHSRLDREPSVAIERFLSAGGIGNPLYLKLVCDGPAGNSADLEKHFGKTTVEKSLKGGEGYLPLPELPTDKACFALGLSGLPVGTCESLGQLW